jgi:predicted nucleic acid-binding protein
MVVVSDTSPIRALANLGLLHILQALYSEILVPPAVANELENPPEGQTNVDIGNVAFIRVHPPSDRSRVDAFLIELDLGEAEVLALALELEADLVLIDEAEGRSNAADVGLNFIGVIGILLESKNAGLIPALGPLLDRLRDEFRFFITPKFRAKALHLAGESDEDLA